MNWGYKILTVYAIFVLGILFLVFKSSLQKVDLVTKDYYGEELKYQNKIDQNKNTTSLSGAIKLDYNNNTLTVEFPKDFLGKAKNGTLILYYPADEHKDLTVPFSINKQTLPVKIPADRRGLYEIHLGWEVEGVKYNFEKKIVL